MFLAGLKFVHVDFGDVKFGHLKFENLRFVHSKFVLLAVTPSASDKTLSLHSRTEPCMFVAIRASCFSPLDTIRASCSLPLRLHVPRH